MRKILVTGASGYVGGRLVTSLLEDNAQVRVFVRDANKAQSHSWASKVEIAVGNASDYQSTLKALTGIHTAFYLLHSINSGTDFDKIEAEMARSFAKAAQDAYPSGHRSITIIRKLYKRNHEDQEPYQYLSSAFPKVRKSNKFVKCARKFADL